MSYRVKLNIEGGKQRDVLAFDRNYFRANPDDPMLLSEYDYRFARLTPQQLHNWRYRLLDGFDQSLPWCRKPRQTVFGGLFNVVTESTGDDDFFYYWFKEGYYLHGVLEFYNAMDEDLPFQRIEFWDAWVTTIDEQMSSWSNMPMLLHFKISPATVRVNKTVKFQQNWFMTDIDEKPVEVFEQEEEKDEKEYKTGVYFDYDGNIIHKGGIHNEYWLIQKEEYKKIQNSAKTETKNKKHRQSLINKKLLDESSGAKRLTISNKEANGVPEGKTTIDYLYEKTNEISEKGIFFEFYCNIVINTKTYKIEYYVIRRGQAESANIYRKEKDYLNDTYHPLIGNIHGHPDKIKKRVDEPYPTLSGTSADDRNAAKRLEITVFNIEGNKIYYYTPYGLSLSPNSYKGTRDARSIIQYAVDIKVDEK